MPSDFQIDKTPNVSTRDHETRKELTKKDEAVVNLEPALKTHHEGQTNIIAPEKEASGGANFWRLLGYSTYFEWTLIGTGIISSAGAGVALPLMNVVVFGRLSAKFTDYSIPGNTITKHDFQSYIDHNVLYVIYLFIGKFILDYISIFCFRMSGIRISAAVRLAYLKTLFAQPISTIDGLPPGSATDSLTTAANTIQMGISDKLGVLVQQVSLIISSYVVAFIWSWKLTLASTSSIVFIFIIYAILNPFWLALYKEILKDNAAAAGIAGETFQAIRTVKALCAEKAMIAKHASKMAEARKKGNKLSPLTGLQLAPAFFAIYGNMALVFYFGVKLYRDGDIASVGNVLLVLFSVLLVVTAMQGVFIPVQNIAKASAASQPLFNVIDSPTRSTSGHRNPEADADSCIEFKDVYFAYPGRPHTAVLKGLHLSVPAGKITALVGPSGCGKSTIVGLLERWYHLSDINISLEQQKKESAGKEKKEGKWTMPDAPTADNVLKPNHAEMSNQDNGIKSDGPVLQNSGSIFLGSLNIEHLDTKWWRAQIGLVQQEPFLFNKSIFENVAYGLIGSEWEHADADQKRELVATACEEAFANEFIQRLPDKYETMVGESGIKLSGGQRQRLAIARSIVKRPSILVLDEATSAIDVRGEGLVQAALDRVSKQRTTITIAHRLSTIKKADHIVVMKDGKTVEDGTHEELLRQSDGVYSGLVRAQHLHLGDEEEDEDSSMLTKVDSKKLVEEDIEELNEAIQEEPTKDKKQKLERGFFGSVGRLLIEQRSSYPIYGLLLLAAMTCGALLAVQSFLTSNLVTVFTYTGQKLTDRGNFWSLMFFVVALVVCLAYAILGYGTQRVSTQVSTYYRQEYFETILQKPITFYDEEGNSSGTLTSRISNDPQQVQDVLGLNMVFPLIGVFSLIGCVIISFVFGWKLSLVAFCVALPVLVSVAFIRMRYELVFESYNSKVFAESSEFGAEAIRAFRTVASLTMEDSIARRYHDLLQTHIDKAFRKAIHGVFFISLTQNAENLAMALVLWYGGTLLADREYSVTDFFVIYIAVVAGGQQAGQFMAFGANFANATAATNRILGARGGSEFEDVKGTMGSLTPPTSEEPSKRRGMSIKISNSSFQYPTRDAPVFRNVSISIKPNEYVAFIGPSGCGKSTIISLLARFYPLSSGSFFIDNTNVASIPLSTYRAEIALVSQEPTLFKGTIRENLILGLPNSDQISDKEIEEACEAAQIHAFISSLPSGYATHLTAGTHSSLSGGQKQRLCIARALLRKPRLLLLDEATSSLDSQNESLVQAVIEKVARQGNVTVVVVAHRLATVQGCNRIVVLGDEGKVLEEGRHGELLKEKGTYWGMCQAQALDR
ncbi:MAG: hypothetical protein M1821_002972 [Bathelium mastoideum]|nr:MAG: hypothetical protein M1821_002972 [Bathelium mastoideum]